MEKETTTGQSLRPGNNQLYDQLGAACGRRQSGEITYLDDLGEQQEVRGLINDLYTDQQVEYVRLYHHKVIRLDCIISLKHQESMGATGL